ncbi:MAG: Gfo/Idh/MocA family oxidoreductase [Planctomycetota bacterium]|nr:Gfo/Idh/MocA family oxidoreductase [Planctomycetota bacterium]
MQFGIGVIGATGFIGTPYREEIRACRDAKIIALCARRMDRLEAAQVADGADLITQRWQDVVEHPDVNVVLVLTPDALHYEAVLACAAAGKHVVCEKPVGVNSREALLMLYALQDKGLASFVPFWTRYVPVFQRAKAIVEAGTLGDIRAIIHRWHNPRPASIPFTWRDDAKLSAAGTIADVGSHAYDTIRWMTGLEAESVKTDADVISPPKPDLGDIDLGEAIAWGQGHSLAESPETKRGIAWDYASIAWRFTNGAVGNIVLSHATALRKGLAPEMELHGTLASLAIDRVSGTVTVARGDGTEQESEKCESTVQGNRFEQYAFPGLREQLESGATTHPTLHDGCRVQFFTDACVRSAQTGKSVKLSVIEAEGPKPTAKQE